MATQAVTLHMQFVADGGKLYTITVINPDKDRSTFAEDVNTAMDEVISLGAVCTADGRVLMEKKRAWLSDVTETEIPLT